MVNSQVRHVLCQNEGILRAAAKASHTCTAPDCPAQAVLVCSEMEAIVIMI